ncbi:MAG: T9SS type A sorting domain-containing protein [bacterium]
MKKFLVCILLLTPVIAFGQGNGSVVVQPKPISGETGSRLDRDYSRCIFNPNRANPERILPDVNTFVMESSDPKAISFNLKDTTIMGPAGGLFDLVGQIRNNISQPVQIIFKRTRIRVMDTTMDDFGHLLNSAGICLCNCYASWIDSLTKFEACRLDSGFLGSMTFSYTPYTSLTFDRTDSMIDQITITALTGDPNDTYTFTVKSIIMPAAGVEKTISPSSAPKILSIYPNPLSQGDAIKVRVSSPKESAVSYSISDAVGRTVGSGVTRQHLNLGDNTLTITSLDGLTTGNYILRITLSDGTNSSRFFQVIR